MGLPKLTSCCCGCSLKDGTIIIGSINLFFSIILVILAIIMAVEANVAVAVLDQASPGWSGDMSTSEVYTSERRHGQVVA